jgi:hypothetical protein
MAFRISTQLDPETVQDFANDEVLTNSERKLVAWALARRPDLWREIRGSEVQQMAVDSLMARYACGCRGIWALEIFGETHSSLNPEIAQELHTRIDLQDGFSKVESNLLQRLWPYVSHRLLVKLVADLPTLEPESQTRVLRAMEGMFAKITQPLSAKAGFEWEPHWDFATEEPRSADFMSKCAKPSEQAWQNCSVTRESQANELLSRLEALKNSVALSSPSAAFESLKSCLANYTNIDGSNEINCDTNISEQVHVLEDVFPHWAADGDLEDDDSCARRNPEGLSTPLEPTIEVKSFQVLEY